jgi:hypothetical protein
MTQGLSETQGEDGPASGTQTDRVHGPPEVDRPGYGGQLWPEPPPGPSSAPKVPKRPRGGIETRKPSRSGRRVVLAGVVLAVAAGMFVTALGIGRATAREDALFSQEQIRDAGFADGLQAGSEDGYAMGLDDGRAKGLKVGRRNGYQDGFQVGKAAGRELGYQDGYAAGREKGYRTGLLRGCQWIFDELKTQRVIDRVPAPGERYWYLTRDQCFVV